ncbi:DUF2442 domain-containing protein [Geminicoccus roseus]|uniref:DUF2442 domain-containing protein n=1 Tax=Geminicoccus roseus TaxID=404900 RepID=UPI000420C460|nr:DUF2442 domain-containing protein [Geminicoccus roseus]
MTDAERHYRQAVAEGRRAAKVEARAKSARYDPETRQLVLKLTSGASFAVPVRLVQGLADADPADLEHIEISPGGEGVHFPAVDADFSVAGLVSGRFGTEAWMQRVASHV